MITSYVFSRIIKGNTSKIVNSFLFSNKCSNNNNNNNSFLNNENKSNSFIGKFLYQKSFYTTNKDDNEKVKSKIKKSKKLNNIKDEEKKKLKGAKIKNEFESQFTDPTIFDECNNNNNDDDNDEAGYQFITVPTKFKEYNNNSNEEENGGIKEVEDEEKEEDEKEVTDIKDLKKPIPPTNLCCGSGCGSSCVWEVYFNEMDEYNKKLKKIDPNAKELPPDTSDDNEDPMQYFLKMERYNSMLQNKREEKQEKEREKEKEEKIINKDDK
ncbi:hypothetical protein ACTFIW_006225 [Dictyostelium discoideum]